MTEETKAIYWVRPGLVLALKENLIYEAGESVELTEAQYKRHQVQLETDGEYKARIAASKTTKTKTKTTDISR